MGGEIVEWRKIVYNEESGRAGNAGSRLCPA